MENRVDPAVEPVDPVPGDSTGSIKNPVFKTLLLSVNSFKKNSRFIKYEEKSV